MSYITRAHPICSNIPFTSTISSKPSFMPMIIFPSSSYPHVSLVLYLPFPVSKFVACCPVLYWWSSEFRSSRFHARSFSFDRVSNILVPPWAAYPTTSLYFFGLITAIQFCCQVWRTESSLSFAIFLSTFIASSGQTFSIASNIAYAFSDSIHFAHLLPSTFRPIPLIEGQLCYNFHNYNFQFQCHRYDLWHWLMHLSLI